MNIREPLSRDDFQRYYELRWEILRAPWKQPRGSEQDALEPSSHHLMVTDDHQAVVAVGRLHFNTTHEAQIRYMAVAAGQQRKGIGTRLLRALENRAVALGAECIKLEARETALGFYLRNNYRPEGPGHRLFNTITHVSMTKSFHR
jgi:ribosomal protein S18 acetylase RimI-like enzyme